ncbi:hypothetical protein OG992_31640 [Micromonospora sp. NBC_00362]|uniref:hypothetical protein n=1 Tax=Micromonospora sp. NBC_00362 TaxID=2975975 RepID=UPI00225B4D67|nr:hypothetical protein [Micromonospora sp. NBC_00362]MCX5121735.1 hypothetical protein [Micromonospora sp. NBC_00362]
MGLVKEGDVVALAQAAAFASATTMQPGAPHQTASLSGLEADQASDPDPAGALAGHLNKLDRSGLSDHRSHVAEIGLPLACRTVACSAC